MHNLAKIMLALAFAIACAAVACAQDTAQPAASPETNKPTAEAKAANTDTTSQDKATIYFYRIKQFAGSALEPSVYMDDKELARMDNGRFFGVRVAPGKHTFRMGDKQTGFEIDMKAGQDYYAKVSLEMGMWKGHGRLTLLQPEQGAFEIKKVKPLGADKIKDRTLVTIFEGRENKQTAEVQSTKH
ncbi:MAG TPA: DUF2846 domain-containing protein [Pyrinomonadaceae bacterium]|jgi:hypothetical protein|nr:DUF2846 domain-containing protein [Pyrinomonadaceae bacterium]